MSFKYLICLDFEATCWEDNLQKHNSEIIEIAAILLNIETGGTESRFHCYVRPTRFPKLSKYCKKLTGIKQKIVDSKDPFPVIFYRFIEWLKSIQKNKGLYFTSLAGIRAQRDGPNTTFCSWSDSDLKFYFRIECERYNIDCPSYLKAWIDMSKRFMIKYSSGSKRKLKFSEALTHANISAVGRAHSALSDATNLAALVMHLIKIGLCFGTAHDYYH